MFKIYGFMKNLNVWKFILIQDIQKDTKYLKYSTHYDAFEE